RIGTAIGGRRFGDKQFMPGDGAAIPLCHSGSTSGAARWFLILHVTFGRHRWAARVLTEMVRSMRVMFPCLSFTETVSLPLANSAIGLVSTSSQTPGVLALNFDARFPPAAMPSTGKSATTAKLSISRPV